MFLTEWKNAIAARVAQTPSLGVTYSVRTAWFRHGADDVPGHAAEREGHFRLPVLPVAAAAGAWIAIRKIKR